MLSSLPSSFVFSSSTSSPIPIAYVDIFRRNHIKNFSFLFLAYCHTQQSPTIGGKNPIIIRMKKSPRNKGWNLCMHSAICSRGRIWRWKFNGSTKWVIFIDYFPSCGKRQFTTIQGLFHRLWPWIVKSYPATLWGLLSYSFGMYNVQNFFFSPRLVFW